MTPSHSAANSTSMSDFSHTRTHLPHRCSAAHTSPADSLSAFFICCVDFASLAVSGSVTSLRCSRMPTRRCSALPRWRVVWNFVDVMGLFAEDVTRLVEEEVVMIEADIRAVYPQAAFIELECAGESSWRMALANDEARKKAGVSGDCEGC